MNKLIKINLAAVAMMGLFLTSCSTPSENLERAEQKVTDANENLKQENEAYKKDMEDYKGDIQTGGKTMPIVWGMITSKVVTFFLIIITIGLLLLASFKFYKEQQYIGVYYILGVVLFLVLLIIQTIRAKTSKDFKIASLLLKFVMLFGIAFTLIIKYLYE
jgi:hypothetical protein